MAIVQEAFDIPDDILTGLATGLYRRIGSVIRYASGPQKGQIVKHLKPVDIKTAEEAMSIGEKALRFVKVHKKGALITIVATTTVSAGALIYNKVKNHEPKIVAEFREALRVYIDAVRDGNMDINKIDKLMAALDKLKSHKDYEKISIQLTTEELEVLVGRIYKYTIKLAQDNDVQLLSDELNTAEMKTSEAISSLRNYLKAQKRIFESVA